MPTYRIKRADKEDQMIEAHSMGDSGTGSYVFYDDDKYVITAVPKDAVLSVEEEKDETR